MKYYQAEEIAQKLDYPSLVEALKEGFKGTYLVPPRMHVDYPATETTNTMLLMPAISNEQFAGVKIVNVAPGNNARGLPSIQGIYYLMEAATGTPIAIFDARAITNKRTAAASALAADFLAPEDASTLLMVGTGSLAPFLIDAHAALRPIRRLMIFGRNRARAEEIATAKNSNFQHVEVADELNEQIVQQADVISVATLSHEPLISGEWLRPGQHVDLVGSYRKDMREADDKVISKSAIYVDTLEMAPKESGDLAIPLANGLIDLPAIRGDLFALCQEKVEGRKGPDQITLFKSVGHALEDLVAAQLIIRKDS